MFLIKETITSFTWLFRVLISFIKVQPTVTIFIIVMQTLSKLIHIIAFLLPLKVLLLVGSDGIPKYFKFFIDDEHKLEWAIGLGIASIVFYVATLVIDAINNRLTLTGGKKISLFGNELMVFPNQEEKAKNYYEKINNIFTLVFFIVLSSAILLLLNTKVAIFLYALVLGFLVITSMVLTYKNDRKSLPIYVPENVMAEWLIENQKNFISIISTIIFLLCFGMILAPYFLGEGDNLIFSLISLILLRQSTNSGKQLINKVISANNNKMDINSIVFVDHVKENQPDMGSLSFLETFNNESRKELLKKFFPNELIKESEIVSSWSETSKLKIKIFDVVVYNKEKEAFYKFYIFKRSAKHLYEREQTLYKHIDRKLLKASEQISAFELENYQCLLISADTGVHPTNIEWKEIYIDYLIYLLKIKPPVDLMKTFRKSEQLLHQRIKKSAMAPAAFGVKNNEEKMDFNNFISRLPLLRKKIRKMPLFIYNKEMTPDNVCWSNKENKNITVLSWKKWTLAPIGAGLKIHENETGDSYIETFIEELQRTREKKKDMITKENIILMSHIWDLEKILKNENYIEAIELIKKINKLF